MNQYGISDYLTKVRTSDNIVGALFTLGLTYNAPLKKYLMCVTDGGNTCSKMSTYILGSSELTDPWKLVSYLKDFGEQAYFVNIPEVSGIILIAQTVSIKYSLLASDRSV